MYQIVGKKNRVTYGCIDQPFDWNINQFQLYNFFNKKEKGLKAKWAYHQFNDIGFLNNNFLIRLTTIDLGYADSVIAFFYDMKEGMKYNFNYQRPKIISKLKFPRNPESYITEFKTEGQELLIMKDHEKGQLEVHANFDSKLIINAVFPFSMNQKPLRVLNPSQLTRFTYTEKYSSLIPLDIDITLKGKSVSVSKNNTKAIFDWSGGYFPSKTNGYKASFAGNCLHGSPVGIQFKESTNTNFYSENGYWINENPTQVPHIIFDFNIQDPHQEWHIYDDKKQLVDLFFKPIGENKFNLKPLSKSYFHSFFGQYTGWLKGTKNVKVQIEKAPGFSELYQSIW